MKLSFQRFLFAAAVGAATVLAALAGYAASPITVDSTSAPGTDFSRYKSYSWTDTREFRNPVVKNFLVAAIDRQLQAKGLVLKDEGADLKVALHPRLSKEHVPSADTTGWDYGWGNFAGSIGDISVGMSARSVSDMTVGTLIVDLVDASKKEIVWRGIAKTPIDSEASAEKQQKLFDKAMQKLFAGFPPKKK